MNKTIVVLGLAMLATGVFAQNAKQAPSAKTAKSQAAKGVPEGVPVDAQEVREGTWRAKDKAGKAWLYTVTPFGVRKTAEEEVKADMDRHSSVPRDTGLKVTGVDGDVVKLETPSPFGLRKWTKKRTELSAGEQSALDAFERGTTTAAKQ